MAASFQEDISEIKFDFTPIEKDRYEVNIHKVEDCTLFVLGSDLYNLEKKKVMFPALSHA